MLFINTSVKIIDNSGIKFFKVIQFFKTKKYSKIIAKFVLATIQLLLTKSKLNKKSVYVCLILTTKFWQRSNTTGIYIKCFDLCGLAFDKTKKPLFSKINVAIPNRLISLVKKNIEFYQKFLKYIRFTF